MFGVTGGEIFGLATGITGLLGLLKVRLHLPGARLEALKNQITILEDEFRDAMEHGVEIVSAWFEDVVRYKEEVATLENRIPQTSSLLKEYNRFIRGYSYKLIQLERQVRHIRRQLKRQRVNNPAEIDAAVTVAPPPERVVATPAGRTAEPAHSPSDIEVLPENIQVYDSLTQLSGGLNVTNSMTTLMTTLSSQMNDHGDPTFILHIERSSVPMPSSDMSVHPASIRASAEMLSTEIQIKDNEAIVTQGFFTLSSVHISQKETVIIINPTDQSPPKITICAAAVA